MPQFYLWPVAAGLLLLTACTKRANPNNGTILRRTISETPDSTLQTHYVYDETGRLVRLQFTHNPSTPNEINEAQLLDFNQAGELQRSYYAEPGNSSYNIYAYSYLGNGDTIVAYYTPFRQIPPTHTRVVILDNRQRVINDSLRFNGFNHVLFYTFTYDATGNVATEQYSQIDNGIRRDIYKRAYTYDTHPNPFQTFGLPYYLATHDSRAFNANNIQTWTENAVLYTWQYNYNTQKLPLQSDMPGAPPVRRWKYNFYYR